MEKYQKIRSIGKGSYGEAILVKKLDEDNKYYVIKQMTVNSQDRKNAIKEARLLAKLDHPNIISYKESFSVGKNTVCIVTDYADGGDLGTKIKNQKGQLMSEDEILDLFAQICLAVKHLHDRKVLHRDLKMQNIFLTKSNIVKLGDFGIAKVLSDTLDKAATSIGTPYYLSPEICRDQKYNNKSDIWSLGCVLYELTTLKHAFEGRNMASLIQNIINGSYDPIVSKHYSIGLTTLIKDMLSKNPTDRPTINEILRRRVVNARIQAFLSERDLKEEFSHTVLHGQHLFDKNGTIIDFKKLNVQEKIIKTPLQNLPPPPVGPRISVIQSKIHQVQPVHPVKVSLPIKKSNLNNKNSKPTDPMISPPKISVSGVPPPPVPVKVKIVDRKPPVPKQEKKIIQQNNKNKDNMQMKNKNILNTFYIKKKLEAEARLLDEKKKRLNIIKQKRLKQQDKNKINELILDKNKNNNNKVKNSNHNDNNKKNIIDKNIPKKSNEDVLAVKNIEEWNADREKRRAQILEKIGGFPTDKSKVSTNDSNNKNPIKENEKITQIFKEIKLNEKIQENIIKETPVVLPTTNSNINKSNNNNNNINNEKKNIVKQEININDNKSNVVNLQENKSNIIIQKETVLQEKEKQKQQEQIEQKEKVQNKQVIVLPAQIKIQVQAQVEQGDDQIEGDQEEDEEQENEEDEIDADNENENEQEQEQDDDIEEEEEQNVQEDQEGEGQEEEKNEEEVDVEVEEENLNENENCLYDEESMDTDANEHLLNNESINENGYINDDINIPKKAVDVEYERMVLALRSVANLEIIDDKDPDIHEKTFENENEDDLDETEITDNIISSEEGNHIIHKMNWNKDIIIIKRFLEEIQSNIIYRKAIEYIINQKNHSNSFEKDNILQNVEIKNILRENYSSNVCILLDKVSDIIKSFK